MAINKNDIAVKVSKRIDKTIVSVIGKNDFNSLVIDRVNLFIGGRYGEESELDKIVGKAVEEKVRELVRNRVETLWHEKLGGEAELEFEKELAKLLPEILTKVIHKVLRMHY